MSIVSLWIVETMTTSLRQQSRRDDKHEWDLVHLAGCCRPDALQVGIIKWFSELEKPVEGNWPVLSRCRCEELFYKGPAGTCSAYVSLA